MKRIARTLHATASFQRGFERIIGRSAERSALVLDSLVKLASNPRHRHLQTHSMRGAPRGIVSCFGDYENRIVFQITPDTKSGRQSILLLDIGTPEQVY